MITPDKARFKPKPKSSPKKSKGRLIITRGISNAGKTTWAKEWMATEGGDNCFRLNLDEIREALSPFMGTPDYSYAQENLVRKTLIGLVDMKLKESYTVIVDNTNLTWNRVAPLFESAKRHKADIFVKELHITLHEAIARSKRRADEGGFFVPVFVIEKMFETLADGEFKPLSDDFDYTIMD